MSRKSAKEKSVSEEDKALFVTMVDQTMPAVVAKPKPRKAATKTKPGGSGVDGGTAQKLKRGTLEPTARLDLHGKTQEAAHRSLLSFLRRSHKAGHRLTLVITGQGNPRGQDEASWMQRPLGVLKDMVPRWLNEPEFTALIASIGPAHVRHGGGGALYVYLRKPE